MNPLGNRPWCLILIGTLLPGALSVPAAGNTPALTAGAIVQRMLARVEAAKTNSQANHYAFQKSIVTEERDGKGQLKERKEKQMLMHPDGSAIQQIRINGRDLTGAELRRQREQEVKAREQYTKPKSAQKEDNYDKYLNGEVIARYKLTQLEPAVLNGRPVFVIAFAPKSGNLPVKTIADRLINQLAGTAWIDQEEFELVKTDVHLQSEISLLAGLIGSLKRLNFTMERTRLEPGVWLQSLFAGDFEARKLLEWVRVKTRAESTNFHRLTTASVVPMPRR